jgi:hypothetical protein
MRQVGVQEHISDELEQVEIAGHEKVQATDVGQVDSAQL